MMFYAIGGPRITTTAVGMGKRIWEECRRKETTSVANAENTIGEVVKTGRERNAQRTHSKSSDAQTER